MVNKKALIELFETQLKNSTLDLKYVGSSMTESPRIQFTSELDSGSQFKSSYTDCEMVLYSKNESFYLSFNSISETISLSEYKRLKKLFFEQEKVYKKKSLDKQNEKDSNLLKEVLFNKVQKEKRKTLIEKVDKVNQEPEFMKKAYSNEKIAMKW